MKKMRIDGARNVGLYTSNEPKVLTVYERRKKCLKSSIMVEKV